MVDFPSNPVAGNTYSINSQTWLYDGAGWVRTTLNTVIPTQTGNAGRYLTTNGSVVTWADSSSVTVVSATQPSLTAAGTLWYDPEYGVLSVYASGVWTDVGGAAASTVLVADNPPVSAIQGNLWFNTTDLNTYVYYTDGDSSQWIAVGIEDPTTAASVLPSQSGNSGRYLTTDGTSTSWATFTGYAGSAGYLGSTGYTGSASTVAGYTGSRGVDGVIGYNGSTGYTGSASTAVGYSGSIGYTGSAGASATLPTQTGNSGKYLTTDGSAASWAAVPATVISSTAPSQPIAGTKWLNTSTGYEYTYYVDVDSSQWIEVAQPSDNLYMILGNLDGGTPTSNYGGTTAIIGGTP